LNSLAAEIHKNKPNAAGNSEKIVHTCSNIGGSRIFLRGAQGRAIRMCTDCIAVKTQFQLFVNKHR